MEVDCGLPGFSQAEGAAKALASVLMQAGINSWGWPFFRLDPASFGGLPFLVSL